MGNLANNGPDREVNGTRILTAERIRGLSDRSLRSYYRVIKRHREWAHEARFEFCCQPRRSGCDVVYSHEPTPDQVQAIRAFDYAFAECRREIKRREQR